VDTNSGKLPLLSHSTGREKHANAVWKIYVAELDGSHMVPIRFPGSFRDCQRKDMVSEKRKVILRSTEKPVPLYEFARIHCRWQGFMAIWQGYLAKDNRQMGQT
jgi:hypothetical protein